jgi:predicted transposase YbfD/YdcC
LDLQGAVVSIDAMGCQKEIARTIVERGGEYIFSLKGNRSTMYDEVRWWLDHAISGQLLAACLDRHEQITKGHGRLETRQVWCTEQIDWFADRGQWVGLGSLIAVASQRQWADGRVEKERRYFISSLPGINAKTFGRLIRNHWQVKNSLPWSLDVSFDEDASWIRNGDGAENFSRLRRTALNLLRWETTERVGIKAKRLRASRDEDYLLKVFTA